MKANNLFKINKVEFYNTYNYYKDGKLTTLNNKQLDAFYNEAKQKNPYLIVIGSIDKDTVTKYSNKLNTKNAEYIVENFLQDIDSKYKNGNFEIYESGDEKEGISFLIRDNLNNLLGSKTFSSLNEPTLCDSKINDKVVITF